ncbi:MAG: serine hydrolase domain-containing protein [Pseudomonadota bacterium]
MRAALLSVALLAAPPALADPAACAKLEMVGGDVTFGVGDVGQPFAIASVGKTMTAVAVLRLYDEGRIDDLDQPLAAYLDPRMMQRFEDGGAVTIWHALTMTSGLPDYYTDAFLDAVLANLDDPLGAQDAVEFAYGEPSVFGPGEDYDYSNTNYVLLGMLIEDVSGLSYAAAMDRYVFGPAGMRDAFVFGSKPLPAAFPKGHEGGEHHRDYYESNGLGDGGVIASAADVAAFYDALLVDQSLLDPQTFEDVMSADEVTAYGYGPGIEFEDGVFGHSGGDLGFASDARYSVDEGWIRIVVAADAEADTRWEGACDG